MVRMYCVATAIAAGVLWAAGDAAAQADGGDFATLDLAGKNAAPQWIVTLGAGVALAPDFLGARTSSFSLMPSDVAIRRAGEPAGFSAPDDGFDVTLIEAGPLAVGAVAGLRNGRSRADDDRLAGLHKLPTTLDAGLFAEYWLIGDRLRARLELRQALWGNGGLMARAGADWVTTYGKFVLSAGPRATFGDDTFMRRNFGVSAAESAANGVLPAFRATAGVAAVGLAGAVRYNVRPDLAITLYDSFDRLVGDAAASPITTTFGSRNQNTVGVNVSYSFGIAY